MLRFLARFLAVLLAAAFVLTALGALFLRPLGTRLLEPATYRQLGRDRQLAQQLPTLAADTLDKALQSARRGAPPAAAEDFASFLGGFTPPEVETLLRAALPADYVQAQLDAVVDQFFHYLDSTAPRPEVRVSLADLKRRLAGGVLEDTYIQILSTKPPCPGAAAALPTTCRPPAEQLPAIRDRFREMIVPATAELPDEVDLFAARDTAQAQHLYTALAAGRDRLHTFATVARWCWILPVLLLLGVALLAVRSLRGALLWWGVPCVIVGGAALVLALPGAAMGDWVFRWFVAPHLPAKVPTLAVEAVLGLVTGLAQVVFGSVMKSGLWLLLGGFAAVIVAFVLRRRTTTP